MRHAKLEHQNLNDRTYAILKGGLISGTFHPGQVFIIRSLAERYGISTTPVREALQRLVAERLLVMLPNRSIVVPSLSPENFAEIYRIRCELEGLAGELATPNFRPSDIVRLKKTLVAMDKTIEQGEKTAYREFNEKFHFEIYKKANQPRLLELIQNLWGQVGPVFYGLLDAPDYGGEHANQHHRQIVQALENGDARSVRQKVAEDLVAAGNALRPRLKILVVNGAEAGSPLGDEVESEAEAEHAVSGLVPDARSRSPRSKGGKAIQKAVSK
jgi:DNA-binding GntR family transcriptional regulator